MGIPDDVIQRVCFSSSANDVASAVHYRWLPHPSLPGNLVGLAFFCQDGVTVTSVQTDMGENLALAVSDDDTTNAEMGFVYYKAGAATGTRRLKITLSGPVQFVQCFPFELFGIRATTTVVGSAHTHSTSASWASGSFTPTENDTFILHICSNSSGNDMTSLAAQAGADLLCADRSDSMTAQCFIQSVAAAINPTLTVAPSTSFLSLTVAFKRDAAQGTRLPRDVPRIRGVHWWNAGRRAGATRTEQFPCVGGSVIGMWMGYGSGDVSDTMNSVVDSVGNPYTLTDSTFVNFAGEPQAFYSLKMTPRSDMTMTFAHDVSTTDSTLVLYDVQAPAGGMLFLSSRQVASGNQAVNGNLSTVSITPEIPNTLILANVGVQNGTVNGLVGSDYLSDTPWSDDEDGGPSSLHEDNGWGHSIDPDGSVRTFVWTYQGSTGAPGAGAWAAQALALAFPVTLPANPSTGLMSPAQRAA